MGMFSSTIQLHNKEPEWFSQLDDLFDQLVDYDPFELTEKAADHSSSDDYEDCLNIESSQGDSDALTFSPWQSALQPQSSGGAAIYDSNLFNFEQFPSYQATEGILPPSAPENSSVSRTPSKSVASPPQPEKLTSASRTRPHSVVSPNMDYTALSRRGWQGGWQETLEADCEKYTPPTFYHNTRVISPPTAEAPYWDDSSLTSASNGSLSYRSQRQVSSQSHYSPLADSFSQLQFSPLLSPATQSSLENMSVSSFRMVSPPSVPRVQGSYLDMAAQFIGLPTTADLPWEQDSAATLDFKYDTGLQFQDTRVQHQWPPSHLGSSTLTEERSNTLDPSIMTNIEPSFYGLGIYDEPHPSRIPQVSPCQELTTEKKKDEKSSKIVGAGARHERETSDGSVSPVASPSSATSRRRRASKGHRRSKTTSSGSRPASVDFVNFTPYDSQKILTGVAPSGSSKTKARREKEAADRRRRLSQAAVRAIMEAGGDLEALEKEGLFVR